MKSIKDIEALLTMAGMILFLIFSFYGLFVIDGERKLDCEIEYASHCGEKCGSDRPAAAVSGTMDDRIEKKACGSYGCHDYRDGRVVECHGNILYCLLCLFVMICPVTFRSIIPHPAETRLQNDVSRLQNAPLPEDAR